MLTCVELHIQGIVQGVGFRPFVFRQAKKHLISGWVNNATDGVHVKAEGEEKNVDAFILSLSLEAPQAAFVKEISIKDAPLEHFDKFEIISSDSSKENEITLVSPDISICDECLGELFDKNDRRFHYPFINCTNCGPRFTIIKSLPYDRKSTSMVCFDMCTSCDREYKDPLDRRFHAQPDACFECGPHIYLDNFKEKIEGDTLEKSDKIFKLAAKMLREGKILAVKGLGGFHFVCDAKNCDALKSLRDKKQRDNKAFAVMVKNAVVARKFCKISNEEKALLKSSEKPIVLLKKENNFNLPYLLSLDLPELGVMLPYTPVQALLINAFEKKTADREAMLVMTSGNLHDCPIVIDDDQAKSKFKGIADAILGNNRKILTRFDDSVVRVLDLGDEQSAIQFIRRARGYAPRPLTIPNASSDFKCLATGSQQKNTFTYAIGEQAFVSQHIGDVDDADVWSSWHEAKKRFEELFDANDKNELSIDAHPDYIASKWAREHALNSELEQHICEIQHHHAHIVSAMAENNINEPVIGFAFDGTGYGADATIWGGEVLLSNLSDYERFANLAYFPLPGGDSAIKNPMRCAAGLFYAYDMVDELKTIVEESSARTSIEIEQDLKEIETSIKLIESGVNVAYTSSMGRLFDAISATLGICPHPTYEGESAIMLEASISQSSFHGDREKIDERYVFDLTKNSATKHSTAHDTSVLVVDAKKILEAIAEDFAREVELKTISKRFHDSISRLVLTIAQIANQVYSIKKCCLAGGVWMNRYLVENTSKILQESGFDVILNKDLPPNDGGLSYGQAVICANKTKNANSED